MIPPDKDVSEDTITIEAWRSPREDRIMALYRCLTAKPRHIPSLYFYDAAGSELFEKITRLPEYYLTRLEKSLLRRAPSTFLPPLDSKDIVEIGSGDCSKISILLGSITLEEVDSVRYLPVDVSETALRFSARSLVRKFPGLQVQGLVTDFMRGLRHLPDERERFFLFLGSTLGNLHPKRAEKFFLNLGQVMRPGEHLLLGVDLVKPVHILERAYNDTAGVTAEFNRNILNSVNRTVGTDFDPALFSHVAFFNKEKSRIEMHLRSRKAITISSSCFPSPLSLKKGEQIHTENSYKFSRNMIITMTEPAGLSLSGSLTDANDWYALFLFIRE